MFLYLYAQRYVHNIQEFVPTQKNWSTVVDQSNNCPKISHSFDTDMLRTIANEIVRHIIICRRSSRWLCQIGILGLSEVQPMQNNNPTRRANSACCTVLWCNYLPNSIFIHFEACGATFFWVWFNRPRRKVEIHVKKKCHHWKEILRTPF